METVVWVDPAALKPHPINASVYGHEDDEKLKQRIAQSGWIKPLVITDDDVVISGHRRRRVAISLGLQVPAERTSFPTPEAELEALLLENDTREKTTDQRIRESRQWRAIEEARAKERQLSGKPADPCDASHTGRTNDLLAKRVGLGSGRTLDRGETVVQAIDNLIGTGETKRAEALRTVLNDQGAVPAEAIIKAAPAVQAEIFQRIENGKQVTANDVRLAERKEQQAIAKAAKGEDDPEPDETLLKQLQEKWSTAFGQRWQIGRHRLIIGDATDEDVYLALMTGDRASAYVVDPPYNVNYVGKTKDAHTVPNDNLTSAESSALLYQAFSHTYNRLTDDASCFVFHADSKRIEFETAYKAAGFHLHQTAQWIKHTFVLGHCNMHYQNEPVLHGWKGKNPWPTDNRETSNCWWFDKPSRSDKHATTKPVPLMMYVVGLATQGLTDAVVLDNFAGSGSTMEAAHRLGHRCYAIELEPKFAAVILERMADLGLEPQQVVSY